MSPDEIAASPDAGSPANRFARVWIDAWNRRDLEAVLSYYADEVQMHSPLAPRLTGSSMVKGKAALRAYWQVGLEQRPHVQFRLLGLYEGQGSLALHYIDEAGCRAIETMLFGSAGKITWAAACYEGPFSWAPVSHPLGSKSAIGSSTQTSTAANRSRT